MGGADPRGTELLRGRHIRTHLCKYQYSLIYELGQMQICEYFHINFVGISVLNEVQ